MNSSMYEADETDRRMDPDGRLAGWSDGPNAENFQYQLGYSDEEQDFDYDVNQSFGSDNG